MVGNVSSVPAWVCHSWVVGLPDIARQTDRKGCLRGHPLVPKLWLHTLHCLFWKTCVDSTLHFNACENQAKDAQGSPASCCLTAPEPPSPLHPPPDLPNRDPKPESKVCHPVSSQDPRPSSPTTPLHCHPNPQEERTDGETEAWSVSEGPTTSQSPCSRVQACPPFYTSWSRGLEQDGPQRPLV